MPSPPDTAAPAAAGEPTTAHPLQRGTTHGRAVERVAFIFYAIAALGSTIGQIWVGVDTPPWPAPLDWWWRALMVAPFAAVIDLGGVVTAAFGDARQRLGETAYGWRILSAGWVTVGVGINLIGHADVPYLSVAFGGLGAAAYAVWLLHAAARRRDALRVAGKLPDTAPAYGPVRWCKERTVTRRARALALAHGYPLHESLDRARQQLAEERTIAALAALVERDIRAQHKDPLRAEIAVTTAPLAAIAEGLMKAFDVAGWTRHIAAGLTAPPLPADSPTPAPASAAAPVNLHKPPADVIRRVPQDQDAYNRWRAAWKHYQANPKITTKELANEFELDIRYIQHVISTGRAGFLESPLTLMTRIMQLASPNGSQPHEPAAAQHPPTAD